MPNRRTFIKTSATGLSLALTGWSPFSCNIPQDNPYLKSIGLMLYTLRDQFREQPREVLEAIAGNGYKQVETADLAQYLDHKRTFQRLRLQVNSSHIPQQILFDGADLSALSEPHRKGFEHLLETAQKEGLTHLVVAWLPDRLQSDPEFYKKLCDVMNSRGVLCKEAGIQLAYHNHNFEFKSIDGLVPYELLIDRLDPEMVKFELDIFWSSVAGIPPVELINRLKGRVCLLHLKDKLAGTPRAYSTGEVNPESFKELGRGVLDIEKVLQAASETGVVYCMVEQDHSPHPLKSIGISMDYLRNL